MPRSLLMKAQTGWSIHVAKPPYRCWRSPLFLIRFASRASIRWLRDVDRPPRRSLSLELLIARGTPPNLEIDPERPLSANFVTVSSLFRTPNFRKRAFPDRSLGGEFS